MKQENQQVTLTGVAQSNERVSELLRNLAYNSAWLTRPELVEIVAQTLTLGAKEQRRVANFTIKVGLRRASDAQKAAAPASGASGPAIAAGPAAPASAAPAAARK